MSKTQRSNGAAKGSSRAATVPMPHEVVVLLVTDIDLTKACYQELGWRLDADFTDDGCRLVQFTPPGSNVSIIFGTVITSDQPDSRSSITAWELESPETAWFWSLAT